MTPDTPPSAAVALPLSAVDAAAAAAMRAGVFLDGTHGEERVGRYRGLVTEVINTYFDAGGLDPRADLGVMANPASWLLYPSPEDVTITGAFYKVEFAFTVGCPDWYEPRLVATLNQIIGSSRYQNRRPGLAWPVWQVDRDRGLMRAFRADDTVPECPAAGEWVQATNVTLALSDVASLAAALGPS